MENENHNWVLPAAIPFEKLKSKDLEECVYWLLDAMGAKDLEWRTGGTGGGAADGGRDLEAHFFEPDADGEIRQQRWWIECKGRKGTIDPNEVKAALNNVLAYEAVDRIIIATNTQYSNPTLDWVKEWQNRHPRPKVQLWDRAHLERYLSRHPDVVLRLFAEALSLDGRIQAMESRFWNKLELVSPRTLADIWEKRYEIELTAAGVFALVANEFANGDISCRPWAATLGEQAALAVLGVGLTNAGYLLLRSHRSGIDARILSRTFAYLTLLVLEKHPPDVIADFVVHFFRSRLETVPDDVVEVLLRPILHQMAAEMQDLCTDDCSRVMLSNRKALFESDEPRTYWLRFEPDVTGEEPDDRMFQIEKRDEPCVVGFGVDNENDCPLFAVEPTVSNIRELFAVVQRVAIFRKAQAAALRLSKR